MKYNPFLKYYGITKTKCSRRHTLKHRMKSGAAQIQELAVTEKKSYHSQWLYSGTNFENLNKLSNASLD